MFFTAGLMVCGGRVVLGRIALPEICLVAGWGFLCVVLTPWGVFLPWRMAPVIAMMALGACRGLWVGPERATGVWLYALLCVPLWFVMAPSLPSQVDTWLNLLPNLGYLFRYSTLPFDGGPAHYSFLPGAPYNTQFAAYAASLAAGGLSANGLSFFNIVLLCAAGLFFARVLADGVLAPLRVPPAWACAGGFLLAVLVNPGFVPRVFFASYGEAPIAVTLMFAVWLSAILLHSVRNGAPVRSIWAGLAFTLCALVNIKQSALGLLLPLLLGLVVLGVFAPGVRRWRWVGLSVSAWVPALLLYGIWRWYVLRYFAVGELKMLPASDWHFAQLPAILAGVAWAMFEKAAYFLTMAAFLAGGAWRARKDLWALETVVLLLGACVTVGFAGFILFTYVAHFPLIWALNAHSFFRYMSQVSLVIMLGLTVWVRPALARFVSAWSASRREIVGSAGVALMLAAPFALIGMLRFDLDAPMPFLRILAAVSAPFLHDGDHVALVVPGDDPDAVGSFLRGTLLFTPPAPKDLVFANALRADPPALAQAARNGFTRALVTCSSSAGLAGIAPRKAGVLGYEHGAWHVLAQVDPPVGLMRRRFSAMISKVSFCE